MLHALTFTGVDAATDLDRAAALADRYPQVEFGVLAGTRSGRPGEPRHPDLHLVRSVPLRLPQTALHLCSHLARAALRCEPAAVDLAEFFGRVQINVDRLSPVHIPGLLAFCDRMDERQVILQHGDPAVVPPVLHNRLEWLFDISGGRGLPSGDRWPDPPRDGRRWGYAGGLGPHRGGISPIVAMLQRTPPDVSVWFDIESGVRTRDAFDLDKVETVCRAVLGDGIPHPAKETSP